MRIRDNHRRSSGPRWLVLAGLVWILGFHVLAPRVIGAAYEERGPSWLNAVIPGRDPISVEHYFDVWHGFVWRLDILALVGLILFLARRPVSRWSARMVRCEPSIGAGRIMVTGLLIGAAGGVLEGVHTGVRKALTPLAPAVFSQSIEAFWMTPIGEAAFGVALSLAIVLATRAWRKPVSLRLVATVLALAAAYGLLRSARLGIGLWPNRLLAAGIAFQAGTWLASRPAGLRRWTPTLLVGIAGWMLCAGLVLHGGRALREWQSGRRLTDPVAGSPNVVLLILDTVRARDLSLYGYARPTTPRLEEMAKDAVLFDRAIAVSSWTLPSHASMLTGHFPWETSVRWSTPLDRTYPTLAEALAGRGYSTAGFVANKAFAGRAAGISRGFHRFVAVPLSLNTLIVNSWLTNDLVVRIQRRFQFQPHLVMDAREVSDHFLEWSAGQGDRPFFAMLNYMDAHSPYQAPDSVNARFTDAGHLNENHRYATYTIREMRQLRASYNAAIAYIDQEIGRIVDTLRARGQLDRTVVIVTSDHGEQFGERDLRLTEHANSLYNTTIHVPLMIRYPAAFPAGTRVARTIGIRRIAATVMEAVGDAASSFPGRSLVDSFSSDGAVPEPPVLSSLQRPGQVHPGEPVAAGPLVSARWMQWHYIRNGRGVEELYDVDADPWEQEDRAGDQRLRTVLLRLRAAAPDSDQLTNGTPATGPMVAGSRS